MRVVALALVAAISGCRGGADVGQPMSAALLAIADEANAALAVSLPPRSVTLRRLRAVVASVSAQPKTRAPGDRLRRAMFDDLGFAVERSAGTLRGTLLPTVLADRRGSCLGLVSLFVAAAEAAGIDARAVAVPGHVFLRVGRGKTARNFELLASGARRANRHYRRRFNVPKTTGHAYLRPLNLGELSALVRFNIANALRTRGDYRTALRHYDAVTAALGGLAEAHANRGLTLQLLGQPAAAARAYQRAREVQPALAGVDRNLAALRRVSPFH